MAFDDSIFDIVLSTEVMEHVRYYKKAHSEIYRVLKPAGTAILQVPLDENRNTTFEDNSIVDPKERTRIFGQYDHVRIYGKDYYDRLKSSGFEARAVDFVNTLSESEQEKFGLPKDERIPLVTKS